MKINIRKSLLALIMGFILLIPVTSAYAEYYIVSPGGYDCYECCYNCCATCYYDMHFSSPHRYHDKGTGQVEEYAWVQ